MGSGNLGVRSQVFPYDLTTQLGVVATAPEQLFPPVPPSNGRHQFRDYVP